MERIKIWTAIDRNRNKVVTFKISKDCNGNDAIVCRQLIDEIKNNNKTKINIIATDGNYSYNKVINTKDIVLIDKNNKNNNKLIIKKDCNKHIVSKSETCLVEAWNSSLRGTSAMFIRRTKCYAKSINSIYNGVLFWQHKDFIKKNIREIINNYWRKSFMYKQRAMPIS